MELNLKFKPIKIYLYEKVTCLFIVFSPFLSQNGLCEGIVYKIINGVRG